MIIRRQYNLTIFISILQFIGMTFQELDHFTDSYWLQISRQEHTIQINIYSIHSQSIPKHKLSKTINFSNLCSPLACFEGPSQFMEFLKDPQNFLFDHQNRYIKLKWEIKGSNYKQTIKHNIELLLNTLDRMDQIRLENYQLRKKLETFQIESVGMNNQKNDESSLCGHNYEAVSGICLNTKVKLEDDQFGDQQDSKDQKPEQNDVQIQKEEHKTAPRKEAHRRKPISKPNNKKKRHLKSQHLQTKKITANSNNERKINIAPSTPKKQRTSIKNNPFSTNQDNTIKLEPIIIKQQETEFKKNPTNTTSQDKTLDVEQPSIKTKQPQNDGNTVKIIEKPHIKYKKITFSKKKEYGSDIEIDERQKVRLQFENKDFYEGEVIRDIYNGFGRYQSLDGSYYEGYWVNGKFHGQGTSVDSAGNKYIGDFFHDKRHGFGIEEYINGQRYEGDFRNDMKQGTGSYHFSNGDIYEGGWSEDKFSGLGQETYSDGTIFEGNWVKDEKHGLGVVKKPDGQKINEFYEMGRLIKSYSIINPLLCLK